jgi:hypothetical protein
MALHEVEHGLSAPIGERIDLEKTMRLVPFGKERACDCEARNPVTQLPAPASASRKGATLHTWQQAGLKPSTPQ